MRADGVNTLGGFKGHLIQSIPEIGPRDIQREFPTLKTVVSRLTGELSSVVSL